MKAFAPMFALGIATITSAAAVEPRNDISSAYVTFYSDINGKGASYKVAPDANKCYSMNFGFNDAISGIRIQTLAGDNAPYHPYCIFNVDNGCKGAGYQLGVPGDLNLAQSGFNDKISSFWCWSSG